MTFIMSHVILTSGVSMARARSESRMKRESGYYALKWLSGKDLSKYRGKWIVVYDQKIVSAAKDLDKAIEKAKLPPDVPPFVMRVPQLPYLAL